MSDERLHWIDDRIEAFNASYNKDRTQASEHARYVYEESIDVSYQRGITLGLLFLGQLDRQQCLFVESESKLLRAAELSRTTCPLLDQVKILQGLGSLYTDMKRMEEAIARLDDAIRLCRESGDLASEAQSTLLISNIHFLLEAPTTSIEYSQRALALYSELQDEKGIAFAFANLGNAYLMIRQPERALEYYRTALSYFLELHSPYNIAALNSNLGDVYILLEDYPRAITYLDSALTWIGADHYPYLTCSIYAARFEAYYKLEELDLAEESLSGAYRIAEDAKADRLIENCQIRESYVRSGSEAQIRA